MKPFFVSFFLFLSYSAAAIVVTPGEWDFGTIESDGGLVSQVVQILNNSEREITVTLISTCGCLTVAPAMLKLQAGESGAVTFFFDPVYEKGRVEKDMIILTTQPGVPKTLFLVRGEVLEARDGKKGGAAARRISGCSCCRQGCSASILLFPRLQELPAFSKTFHSRTGKKT